VRQLRIHDEAVAGAEAVMTGGLVKKATVNQFTVCLARGLLDFSLT
jgi:hypothetical protein